LLILPLLIAVALLTLVERKFLASMQKRIGPNFVGLLGLLQPIADAAKLIFKETVLPRTVNILLFLIAPIATFFLSLSGWAVIPFNFSYVLADIDLGLLYLFAISSLGVYGLIVAGWSSNSRYAFLGALRSSAQMISYEVSIGLILINIVLCVGSLNLTQIVTYQENVWFCFPLLPLFILCFISGLAETNRPPFDLPEAEGELVAGYNVEYSSISFALFFIGEYANIILFSILIVICFLGGWNPSSILLSFFAFLLHKDFNISILISTISLITFLTKLLIVLGIFIWVRAALPRYRYDQLMRLGWKVFFPLSLGLVVFTSSLLYISNSLPS